MFLTFKKQFHLPAICKTVELSYFSALFLTHIDMYTLFLLLTIFLFLLINTEILIVVTECGLRQDDDV